FVWNIWWVRESLLRLHQNPFFTSYLFYPDGVPLVFHTFSFSLGLASVPLQLALPGGALTAHNVLVVAAPALAVLALALLAHELTGDPSAALVGGLAGAGTGTTVWYLPVLYLDCAYLIAFVLWAWWRLHRLARPLCRFRLAAAVLLSLMALRPYRRWPQPFQGPPPRLSPGHGFPGPYLVALKVLPLFRFFRAPYRWTVGAQVALGVLAALGVA